MQEGDHNYWGRVMMDELGTVVWPMVHHNWLLLSLTTVANSNSKEEKEEEESKRPTRTN